MTLTALALFFGSLTSPSSVVVFPDRAVVTRSALITCGQQPIRFEGVPLSALESSFRARCSEGSINGLNSEKVTSNDVLADPRHPVRQKLASLREERRLLEDEAVAAAEQATLTQALDEISMRMLSRELALDRPDPAAWRLALDTSLGKSITLAKSSAELEGRRRELKRRESETNAQYSALTFGSSQQTYAVDVSVSCPAGAQVSIDLSYVVPGASWAPMYEARAGQSSIELSTYATVSQATGEPWVDVELALSTASAAADATPAEIRKLVVTGYKQEVHKKVLVRRDEIVTHAESGANDGVSSAEGLDASNEGLSVRLTAAERAQVPADSSTVRVLVGKARLKAAYELRVVPKRSPVAFRVAQLVNQLPWPLLPGPVEVFRETGLVGRYLLGRVAEGAPFTLTLGIEDSVRVKRIVVDELKKDTGLFGGGATRLDYAYRFEVANYGPKPVEVLVSDHLPVSELADLTVKVGEKTTPGYSLVAADGIATWKLPLKSQERKNVDFAFRVEVPGSYDTGSL